MTSEASRVAAATPTTRDRYVDLLRVAALAMVMLGHFLMVGVEVAPDGDIEVGNSLVRVPDARLLTWAFQVMPVFFAVGGFSHALTLRSLDRRGAAYADFAASRARRLLEPTTAFVVTGLVVAAVVEAAGAADDQVESVLRVVGQPLWFVGIYLGVVAFAPVMLRLHRRFGIAVVVALSVAVVTVDVLHLRVGLPYVGYLNFAFLWLAVHQLGFLWADGLLARRRVAGVMAASGLAAAVTLVALGPYPLSMISLPGEEVSNLVPPSAALLALAFGQLGLLLLLRDPANRWLQKPGLWTVVVAANAVVMTAFLWHFTAIVLVNAAMVGAGVPMPAVGSATWWWSRLPVLLAVGIVLAGLVAAFRRFEVRPPVTVPRPSDRRAHRDGLAACGLAAATLGVLGFSMTGFAGTTTLATATLVVLRMTPLVNLLLLVAGWRLVAQVAAPRPQRDRPPPPSGG